MKKDTNLDFDGMAGTGVNRKAASYAGNQSGKTMPMNVGMGPRTGNASSSSDMKGIDHKKTIATAAQGGKINGGATCKPFGNPSKINVGIGPRKGNA
jgi:hypothetical protein